MGTGETIRILESIGLSKNEVFVYLDLLKEGKASANDIAKGTKLHRSNIYDIVKGLVKKGIITQSLENNKKIFYPINPKNLLAYLKQKEYDLEKIIPNLKEIHSKPIEKRKISISEGIQALRETMTSMLGLKKTIYAYGIPKEVVDIVGGFIVGFHKDRIKKKIIMKHLYNENARERIKYLNSLKFTEAKHLPPLFDSKITTLICGQKVIMMFWEKPISTIIIENKSIAKTYKNYFELIWEKAKSS